METLEERLAPATIRVSTSFLGLEGNRDSFFPSVSTDGRYVTFESSAENLVAGDTNGKIDIFVKDTDTGVVIRVSTDSAGFQSNRDSFDPVISADGRYVAFTSKASNLVPGDTNGKHDIFVKDTMTGAILRASTDAAGLQGKGYSIDPVISADGRYVAFVSDSKKLVPLDDNRSFDIFVKDTTTGAIIRASVDIAGLESNHDSFTPSISADGRYVAFRSLSDNLIDDNEDKDGFMDVFLKDTLTGTVTRISTDATGELHKGDSWSPAVSADGRYVAFMSQANDLVAGDTNGKHDIFLKDTTNGAITRISTDAVGAQSKGDSFAPSISADGRFVAFVSRASNLVAGDTNGVADVFRKDTLTGAITRVSTSSSGGQGNLLSDFASLSADGQNIAFASETPIFVTGDTNAKFDIFLWNNPD